MTLIAAAIRPLVGAPPETIPGALARRGRSEAHMPGPPRRRLSPLQGDVLALLVRPRTMRGVADSLAIETPTARWALDTLVRRGLAEEVDRYPTRWAAT